MIKFLITCFLVGVSASSAIGPIFILTFNRSALYGFRHGFATALGASLVDGLFFLLSAAGVLSLFLRFTTATLLIDLIGGLVLLAMGGKILIKQQQVLVDQQLLVEKTSLVASFFKAFFITFFNPLVMFFFMGICLKCFGVIAVTTVPLLMGGALVMLGSLTMLSIVALCARYLGSIMTPRILRIVSYASGLLFIGIGAHFMISFASKILS